MSTDYDLICCFEATEFTEADVEQLTTRLNRTKTAPYNQIICDCNPAGEKHWLNVAAHAGRFERILSRHEDNPSIQPAFLDRLKNLTGVRRKRLYEGKWVQAEGLVYDTFSRSEHVREKPPHWVTVRVVLGVDDGYVNPFCVLRGELNGDGRLRITAEVYERGLQRSDKIKRIKALADGAEAVVIDPSAAELIDACLNEGLPAEKADNSKIWGISGVQDRLALRDDEMPGMEIDPACVNLLSEIEGYRWKDAKAKEEPIKEDDHGCDGMRYLVARVDAGVGGRVYTPAPKVALPASGIKSDSAVTIMGRRSAWTAFEGNGSGGFR